MLESKSEQITRQEPRSAAGPEGQGLRIWAPGDEEEIWHAARALWENPEHRGNSRRLGELLGIRRDLLKLDGENENNHVPQRLLLRVDDQ